jgi:hypothetical protein
MKFKKGHKFAKAGEMKKRRRDPRDLWNEVNGGVICRRGYLLLAKESKSAKKQQSKEGESFIEQEITRAFEWELRDVLRKLPGLRSFERKNRGAGKPREKWRDSMIVDRRSLRRVVKERILEPARTPPGTSLN